jgi:hypothetical protein
MTEGSAEHGKAGENDTAANRRQLLGVLGGAGMAGLAGCGSSGGGGGGAAAVTEPADPLSTPTGAV